MAPRPRPEPVHDPARLDPIEQVRASLEGAKRQGVPFGRAWKQALAGVRWGSSRTSCELALTSTRAAWARAYRDEPDGIAGMLEHLLQPSDDYESDGDRHEPVSAGRGGFRVELGR
jgi:hypothetical protein